MIFTDQINHTINLESFPKRIISLVPSQTELLYDLGLEDEVVGITKFCIHPKKWFDNKNRVGGTKNISLSKIADLKPDLIIANKEENTKEEIEELQKRYPVYTSDISNLEESIDMIKSVGEITNRVKEAGVITTEINYQFTLLSLIDSKNHLILYLIWRKPYMSINQSTFISDMMQRCGFQNVISGNIEYPEITKSQILALNPDLIFLSSEPYPFKEKHVEELQKACPNSKIILVDGEYFSWYGSRLQDAVSYFTGLINEIS